ncbi:MAG: lysophospholipid acyltransferase family protein [Candidatus Limnocylindrales bacterium]
MGWWHRLVGGGEASNARARRPAALAASLADAPREGLDWLGRRPSAEAPRLYRVLLRLGEVFLYRVCAIRIRVEGREASPRGGYILVVALHRSWIDPRVVLRALPVEPRVWFMGSGPTAFDRPWKERLLRRTGGILPVWRGGVGIDVHVEAARAVVEEGAVLALFIEGRIAGPPDRPARARDGAALLALRTDAPIVLMALCGSEVLYRGKRISARLLPPTSVSELIGPRDGTDAVPGTRAELRLAHALTTAMTERIAAAVTLDHPGTVDPPDHPRRWPWLSRLMR